jgi:hypothetical protein
VNSVNLIIQKIGQIIEENNINEWRGGITDSANTTLIKGDVYFMGFNPGYAHKDDDIAALISDDIHKLYSQIESEFLKNEWASNFQERVKFLFKSLDVEVENTFFTNLIFKQSSRMNGVNYWADAKTCWPVHEYLINEVVKPKVIICMGNKEGESAYAYLKDFVYKKETTDTIHSNHGSWKIKAFETGVETPKWVIGFPHFSYYKLEGKKDESKILNWVKEKM